MESKRFHPTQSLLRYDHATGSSRLRLFVGTSDVDDLWTITQAWRSCLLSINPEL